MLVDLPCDWLMSFLVCEFHEMVLRRYSVTAQSSVSAWWWMESSELGRAINTVSSLTCSRLNRIGARCSEVGTQSVESCPLHTRTLCILHTTLSLQL